MSALPDDVAYQESLERVTIGGARPLSGGVELRRYDPEWPAVFEREAARLRAVLGDRVRLLGHVGSTSVPGLAAKPVIDMVLEVGDSADEAAYVPGLEAAGYELRVREPESFEHRLFKRLLKNDASPPECDGYARETDAGNGNSSAIAVTEDTVSRRTVRSGGRGFVLQQPHRGPGADINLHVFSAGCAETLRMLGFRDHLRSHPEDRDLYARVKSELAARSWTYMQQYADAKSDVVAEIMGRAGV